MEPLDNGNEREHRYSQHYERGTSQTAHDGAVRRSSTVGASPRRRLFGTIGQRRTAISITSIGPLIGMSGKSERALRTLTGSVP